MVFCIEADNRIMTGEPVFDDQSCDRSAGVFGEKHVVSDAEADEDIECGLGPVEKLSLKQRIAAGFEFPWVSDFIVRGDTQFGLIHSPAAADR